MIDKTMIQETIAISKKILELSIDGESITKDSPVQKKYRENIYWEKKPDNTLIHSFKQRNSDKTPNQKLDMILKDFIKKNDLLTDCNAEHFSFHGQKINSYVWACVYPKPSTDFIKDRKASHFPQLYILIRP